MIEVNQVLIEYRDFLINVYCKDVIDKNDVLKFLESDFCYMTLLDLSIKQEMYKLNCNNTLYNVILIWYNYHIINKQRAYHVTYIN